MLDTPEREDGRCDECGSCDNCHPSCSFVTDAAACVVCGDPVTHGCNTAACSEACLAKCRPCPVCDELVAPGGDPFCGAYCARIAASEEREAERRCGC